MYHKNWNNYNKVLGLQNRTDIFIQKLTNSLGSWCRVTPACVWICHFDKKNDWKINTKVNVSYFISVHIFCAPKRGGRSNMCIRKLSNNWVFFLGIFCCQFYLTYLALFQCSRRLHDLKIIFHNKQTNTNIHVE